MLKKCSELFVGALYLSRKYMLESAVPLVQHGIPCLVHYSGAWHVCDSILGSFWHKYSLFFMYCICRSLHLKYNFLKVLLISYDVSLNIWYEVSVPSIVGCEASIRCVSCLSCCSTCSSCISCISRSIASVNVAHYAWLPAECYVSTHDFVFCRPCVWFLCGRLFRKTLLQSQADPHYQNAAICTVSVIVKSKSFYS